MAISKLGLVLVAVSCLAGSVCEGQTGSAPRESSHFGVTVSGAPQWSTNSRIFEQVLSVDKVDLHGREFTIGFIVRGRPTGGDWGVSYVGKTIADESEVRTASSSRCVQGPNKPEQCFEDSTSYKFSSASLRGFEVHKFAPIKTFRERFQIGLNMAAGVGWFTGHTNRDRLRHDFVFNPTTNDYIVTPVSSREGLDIKTFLAEEGARNIVPLAKFELVGTVILPRGAKIVAGGGFDSPGFRKFGVRFVYLIGVTDQPRVVAGKAGS